MSAACSFPGCGRSVVALGDCVRGLLCANCNTGIGQFRDNINTLWAAIEYLTKDAK